MSNSIKQAKEVLKIEAESILSLANKIDSGFSRAVEIIDKAKGRVIVTGIGKSGLVGKKIVATLTSTGTPAIFLHPVEGLHGDLGIVTRDDVMLAISNSGETSELNTLVLSVKETGLSLIAFTGNMDSTLAKSSDVVINVGVDREACPFGLAPTSSTTAALAMGDALAVVLVKKMGFTKSDFYKFHPGGHLGQRLMSRVKDVMIDGDNIPGVFSRTSAIEAIEEMDRKNVGFIFITDRENHLLGILTDGDLRRYIRKGTELKIKFVDDLMTEAPKTIVPDTSLAQAIEIMQRDEITALAIIDSDKHLEGYVHLHDILGRGGTIKISIP
ncbi:MAG: KpsF/GutQ family sugar-phosphate isomerase [Thermodesulfobacteriota bacterium]|nr:KpsF/GutQ family sugar-phosphate isomerase [Thermodesulfobacteriota bacterium]